MYTIIITFTHGDDLVVKTDNLVSTIHQLFDVHGVDSIVNLRILPSLTVNQQVEIPFPQKDVLEK